MRSALFGGLLLVVLLAVIVAGRYQWQEKEIQWRFHTAEEKLRHQIESERLIGSSRSRVKRFLDRIGVGHDWYMTDRESGKDPGDADRDIHAPNPYVSPILVGFTQWTSEVEFRFDRNHHLVSYRFEHTWSTL